MRITSVFPSLNDHKADLGSICPKDPGVSKGEMFWFIVVSPRRRQWHTTPVLLPGESHGRRSLGGYSAWGLEELDTTEWLHFHFSLSCTGEGNGNPFQCSCLENPRDRGAWWVAVYGVTQSRTRLKWLSSSSTSSRPHERYHWIFHLLKFLKMTEKLEKGFDSVFFSRNKSFHAKVSEWDFWLLQVDRDIALRIPHS